MSIATQMQRLRDIREDIRGALALKKVADTANMKFADFANAILSIQSGIDVSDTTAIEENVLLDMIFHLANGESAVGSMPNNGAWTPDNINPSGSIIIPKGYHDGTGRVTANPNQNSGTYTFGSNSGGTVDLGANNTYRYANASNVYNYGYNAGRTLKAGTYTSAALGSTVTINCGFTPTYVAISCRASSSTGYAALYYNGTVIYHRTQSSSACTITTDGSATTIKIVSNGFTSQTPNNSGMGSKTVYYMAFR